MGKDTIVRDCLLKLLRQARTEANLTQVELAALLDQPQSFVSKYECGERRLDIAELYGICRALGISMTEFMRHLEDAIRAAQ